MIISHSGPSRASSGPGAINSTGPCVGVAAQGQEGDYNKCKSIQNSYKTLLVFHNGVFKLLHVNVYFKNQHCWFLKYTLTWSNLKTPLWNTNNVL